MQLKKIMLFLILAATPNLFSQVIVTPIEVKNKTHYITTTIGYPVSGTYLFEGESGPIVSLNDNGSGIYQLHNQPEKRMVWGIECSQKGIPKFREGFDSAVYTLWYKTDAAESQTEQIVEWNEVQFSIHFKKKKMFISGEREKSYKEDE
ncbi:hypothetical protein [Flavobacterium crassostreae]|uniref:Uncharacterized protein n=1 Tax=Flavobacterium crassostreae TaxID=1763534 RepID=A0A1B9E0R8_9FLAO|nr:hypothetical protein [Flavobacterium crassostreae]OCB75517.1 hypothetical protein LPBF_07905 [Flavobacterium crassostreae]